MKKKISIAMTVVTCVLLVLFLVVFFLNLRDILEADKAIKINRWNAMHLVNEPSVFVYVTTMFSTSVLGIICSIISAKIAYCKKIKGFSIILSFFFILSLILSFSSVVVWVVMHSEAFTH